MKDKILKKRNALVGLIAASIVVTPIALNRCGKGLDTDKTISSPKASVSTSPTVTPAPSASSALPFSPNQISGLVAWYRAEYFGTQGMDYGQTITLAWNNAVDSSLGALTPVSTPVYYTSAGPNSTPAVHFDAAIDKFVAQAASGLSTTVTGFTSFVIAKSQLAGTGIYWMNSNFPANITCATYDSMFLGGATTFTQAGLCRGASYAVPTINLDSNFHIFRTTWDSTSTNLTLDISGLGAQSTTSVGSSINLSGDFMLGYDGSNYMNGYISEVLIWTRLLSQSEIDLINTYFRNKYGL